MNLKRHLFQSFSPLVLVSVLASAVYAESGPVLREGTPVRLKIIQNISTANAQEGEHVSFETLGDVKANGQVVIPSGSMALATVTEAVPKHHFARGGKLGINIDSVRLSNGDKIPLRGVQNVKGGGHVAAMTTGIVATGIVFWPAAPLFLLVEGKEGKISDGYEITVYTDADYAPVPTDAGNSRAPRSAALHDVDIVKLVKAGFSEETILTRVQSAPGMYELGSDDLWRLKAAGVSENIIRAMFSAPER